MPSFTNVVRIIPFKTDLKVMILRNQAKEPVQYMVRFPFCEPVNVANMSADWINALPSSHRISAHNRVDGLQFNAHILWGAAPFLVQLETGLTRDLVISGLSESRSESFQESLIWLTNTIVDFVSRSP